MDKKMVVGESTTTSSLPSTSIVKGSQQFKITRYSLLNGIGSGKYLASDTLSVGGHDWAIYCYPDGQNDDDNAAYVSLFIVLVSEASKDVTALFELALLDQSGNEKHKLHSQFQTIPQSGPYTLKCCGSKWGFKRFIKKTDLEASKFLKDDCLYVNCRVGVVSNCREGLD
ncbi:BTB/POZ and MATH domain-containing protein 4-like [Abrus precatorius]|uniref:BTB/POZ and MATH domain-containing protein 4-like n=1 Tax=Abrus precatorius TaxID=3816 RepID=A0A8B8LAM6_ABRPR|nr:BTB/POZ and MATH domain-containing protein 4-like [Abrus precatorius]